MSAHKCEAILASCFVRGRPCAQIAPFEHGGRWHCKAHHPPILEAKFEAKEARARAERAKELAHHKAKDDAQAEQKRRADCYPDLLAQLDTCATHIASTRGNSDPYAVAAFAAIAKATGVQP